MELLIPDEIITLPYLSDPLLPLINDTYPPVVLPEPEAKINAPPLPPTDEPADIVVSPPLLTNDSPSIIVSASPLLNDDTLNVKFSNYQSLSDGTSVFIIIVSLVPFSPDSTSTITGPAEPDDEIPVLTKVLPISPFNESPLFNINDSLTPLLPVSILSIVTHPEALIKDMPGGH